MAIFERYAVSLDENVYLSYKILNVLNKQLSKT